MLILFSSIPSEVALFIFLILTFPNGKKKILFDADFAVPSEKKNFCICSMLILCSWQSSTFLDMICSMLIFCSWQSSTFLDMFDVNFV